MIFLRTKWPKFVQFNIFLNPECITIEKLWKQTHNACEKHTSALYLLHVKCIAPITLHRPIKSLATASKSSSPQTLLWTWRTAIWLSRSCVMVDLRYVFSLRRVENDRSADVLADHVLILSTFFHWNLIYGPNSSGCDAPTGVFLWVHSHPTLPRSRRLWQYLCHNPALTERLVYADQRRRAGSALEACSRRCGFASA